jgi:hypothetical protein
MSFSCLSLFFVSLCLESDDFDCHSMRPGDLADLNSKRVDGKFLGPGGSSVPTGQAILVGLMEANFEICQDIKAREAEGDISMPLKPIFERLQEMKGQLDRLCEWL